MGKINKRLASEEVDAFIKELNIRAHKLDKLKDHKADLVAMVAHGIVEIDGKNVIYHLEEKLSDGTEKLIIKGTRYSVEQVEAMAGEFDGSAMEKALGVFGCMCEPIVPSAMLSGLKEGFSDINAISAFFLPI